MADPLLTLRFAFFFPQYEQDGTEFDATEYMAETPGWALKDAVEEGFDPAVSGLCMAAGGMGRAGLKELGGVVVCVGVDGLGFPPPRLPVPA